MTTKKKILSMLLATGLLTACTADDGGSDVPDGGQGANGTQQTEITLHADVHRMVEGTRATTIDNATGLQAQDIRIDAYFHGTGTAYLDGVKLHYDTDAWKFWAASAETHYYWPIEGSVYDPSSANITVSSLDFVGYCPYTQPDYITSGPSYDHTTGITFTSSLISPTDYMTAASQASMTEYICTILDGQTYATQTANGGALPLLLRHPFARIRFQLAASHPDITINSITFKHLKTAGFCTLSPAGNATWTSLTPAEGGTDFVLTLTGDAAVFNNNPAATRQIGEYYLMIPQDWAGEIEVDADCLFWGEKINYPSLTTTVPTAWQPGYSYTYTFNISPDDLRVDTAKYTEQW